MKFRNEEICIEERVADLLQKLTVEEKIGLLASEQQPVERLGIKKRFIGTEFARVNVPAGESKAVILTAPKHMLECYSEEEQAFVLERGEYTFHVGPDSSKYYADLVHDI